MARDTNLSCLLYGPGKVRFVDRQVPSIEDPHDILIRISYVGVCGSDAHFWTHGGVMRKVSEEEPLVMGHEASGIVHSVGPAVTSVVPGDRVAVEPGFPCRRCKQCKAGRYNICPDMKFAADPPGNHGTLARFFRIPEDFAYKIPDSLSLQEAVLVEPLSVAVHGVRTAMLAPGQSVLVQGSGTIGLLAATTAKAFGARAVFIADINNAKLDFAKTFVGCDTFVPDLTSTPYEEAARFKKEMDLEDGVDVILECTGVESSVQTGLYASAAGGVLVQIGLGKADLTLPILAMCEKETVLKTAWRYAPGDYEVALELLKSGKISVKPLISSTVSFENAPEAWEKTRKGEGIKNIIEGVQDEHDV
ncbi:GroES-like protein [Lipomyces orientalis]|uniref:GroES-like protein n=1 Tax=Lipomyces orientalis TaxID=1233043 RepID=A0ACC3TDB3_9ASCO